MPGKPGRATAEMMTERIEFTRQLIGRCQTKSMIKAAFRKRYGETDGRTVEDYIARARRAIDVDAGRGVEIMRTQQVEFYQAMMATAARDCDKIRAAERLDKVKGLEAPAQIEHAGADGKPLIEIVRIIRPAGARPVNENGLVERQQLNGQS